MGGMPLLDLGADGRLGRVAARGAWECQLGEGGIGEVLSQSGGLDPERNE